MKSKLAWQHIYQSETARIIFIALLTAITGELKVIPFAGEPFRFALGGIVFFLLILIYPPKSILRTGLVTAVTVVLFRVIEQLLLGADLAESVQMHLPVVLFYFLFAAGWHFVGLEKFKSHPLQLGMLAILFEIVGNTAEHAVRNWWTAHYLLDVKEWSILVGVALLRSFFTVGLYSSVALSKEKQRVREILGIGSELYAETLYLQKSMDHMEQITASSYDLYRKLQQGEQRPLGIQALQIAQEIHEVKKDSQRILAGLSQLTKLEEMPVFSISTIMEMVQSANQKYSKMLGKQVTFYIKQTTDFQTEQHILLLAILNNLTANAVEAIEHTGTVRMTVSLTGGQVYFQIIDDGKGISADNQKLIFEPGFTTKYNDQGAQATGIGLSHVKAITESLGGSVEVNELEKGTLFQVNVPLERLQQ
ncbi:ATP-binding protein [Sporosarcina highlanderae]|uniref:histidine kinase n=1 Tax=Sporosarcina highlanderae TaxID=3035916 RepID=A0ABT8JMK2_9BACL|nr:ATP-binding protein [Sporosarcina highlanderae]MDN4606304.1 ATP-binding protein [Sporosarcina highlanderae]